MKTSDLPRVKTQKLLKGQGPPEDQAEDDSAAGQPQPQFKKFCNRRAPAPV